MIVCVHEHIFALYSYHSSFFLSDRSVMGSVFSTPSENASREGNRELQLFPSQQQMGEPSQQMVPLRTTQAATAAGALNMTFVFR